MKHKIKGKKFGREKNQRKALFRSLLVSLIERGRIFTTEAKAKELRPITEKLITKAQDESLSTRRLLLSRLGNNKKALERLVKEIAPKYKGRKGGYTRILKLPARKSDSSKRALIEFV